MVRNDEEVEGDERCMPYVAYYWQSGDRGLLLNSTEHNLRQNFFPS
jgi:hypothetical protein